MAVGPSVWPLNKETDIWAPKGIMQGCKLKLREGYPGIKREMDDIRSTSTEYVKTGEFTLSVPF